MRLATFGQLLQWLQEPLGKTVVANRPEIVKQANRVRQLFYLMYDDNATVFTVEECMEIQKFPVDCDDCREFYLGLTLPDHMDQVEAMWRNSQRVVLHNRWREYKYGIVPDESCKLEKFDLHTTYPTELDIAVGCCSRLKLLAHDSRDFGKEARITYRDSGGQKHSEIVKLAQEFQQIDREAKLIFQGGVVLPELEGGVTLAEGSGRILSEYLPHERVPTYKRIKITGVDEGDQVNVVALARFTPKFYDHDVIETDNELAWTEGAKYLKFNDSESPEVLAKAEAHLIRCKQYLFGERSRDLGKTTIRQVKFGPLRPRRSGLRKNMRTVGRYGL